MGSNSKPVPFPGGASGCRHAYTVSARNIVASTDFPSCIEDIEEGALPSPSSTWICIEKSDSVDRCSWASRSSLRSVAASGPWLTQSTLSNSREKRSGPSEVSSLAVQKRDTDGEEDQLSMGVRLSAVDIFGFEE